jgi:hypothetical protein
MRADGRDAAGRSLPIGRGCATAIFMTGSDLLPTRDVCAHAAWAMRGLIELDRAVLEQAIFPGLDLGSNLGLVL